MSPEYSGLIFWIFVFTILWFSYYFLAIIRTWKYCKNETISDSDIDLMLAESRANQLLDSIMTEEERACLLRTGFIEVDSSLFPGRVYRISKSPGVVKVYEYGRLIEFICVQPVKFLPNSDVILMHKLFIESDELHYLRVANCWLTSLVKSREVRRR